MTKMRFFFTVLFFLLTANFLKAYDFETEGIYFNITSASKLECEVTSSPNLYVGDISIPEKVNYNGKTLSVVSIGNDAFNGCINVTSVFVPEGVREFGSGSFRGCGIEYIEVPTTILSIKDWAFANCQNLVEVRIKDLSNWCKINFGKNANPLSVAHYLYLNNDKITELKMPEDITILRNTPFYGLIVESFDTNKLVEYNYYSLNDFSVKNLIIGSGLTMVSVNPFETLSELENIYVSESNNCFASLDGVLYSKDLTKLLKVPYKKDINEFVITNNVKYIGEGAFQNLSQLQKIIILDSEVPLECTYNKSNTNGGEGQFYDCNLTSLYLGRTLIYGEGNRNFGYSPFYNQKCLGSIEIGLFVTRLGAYLFNQSDVTTFNVPSFIAEYDLSVFGNLKELYIEDSNDELTIGHTINLKLDKVYMGRNLSYSMPPYEKDRFSPFGKNTLSTFEVGQYVTTVPWYCCNECSNLQVVKLGSNVRKFDYKAFKGCNSFCTIELYSTIPPNFNESDFIEDQYLNMDINVIKGSLSTYTNDINWGKFWNISDVLNPIGSINDGLVDDKYSNEPCYDLNGRRILNINSYKGVYLRNNKKYLKNIF